MAGSIQDAISFSSWLLSCGKLYLRQCFISHGVGLAACTQKACTAVCTPTATACFGLFVLCGLTCGSLFLGDWPGSVHSDVDIHSDCLLWVLCPVQSDLLAVAPPCHSLLPCAYPDVAKTGQVKHIIASSDNPQQFADRRPKKLFLLMQPALQQHAHQAHNEYLCPCPGEQLIFIRYLRCRSPAQPRGLTASPHLGAHP